MSREGDDDIDVESFKAKIFDYVEKFKFNKVVSEFMTLVNKERTKNLKPEIKEQLISILEIFMPKIKDKL